MPQVRKLEPEEVKAYQNKGKGQRKLIEEEYDAALAGYEIGDYGEAVLDEGENRLTVRNRMKAAATRRGIGISFRRTNGDLIRFQIVDPGNGTVAYAAQAEAPLVVSSEPPAKRKGGRSKAQDKGPMARLEEIASKVQDAAKGALEEMGLREPAKRKSGRPKKNPAA